MRILVLKNNKYKSAYIACIYLLLQEIGPEQHYSIQLAENLNNTNPPTANSVTFASITFASFISKLIAQQKLQSFIKENKIDLLIQNTIHPFKQKTIPQLLIADDIEKLPAIKKISYSKIFLLTYSHVAKQAIAEKGFTNVVHVIPFVADALFQPITWSMQQQIKIDYTEGREYFFTSNNFISIDELLNLLKAFSAFKKWQQSSMKLVITGQLYVPPNDWQEKLSTFKYREDVLIYNTLTEEKKALLLAGAYASIHLPKNDNDLLPLIQSVQCHIPVIAFETPSVKEYAADAILTTAADNYEELTQQMILLYKDENLRSRLVENCAVYASAYSKEKAMEALLRIIL